MVRERGLDHAGGHAHVLARVEQFAQKLQLTDEVSRFRTAERSVNDSARVQQLIADIKRTQKELVHAEHYVKPGYKQRLEQKLAQLNDELDNLPIVREYQQSQVEMNDLLQLIQHTIASGVSQALEVETGGEVRSGCGSGGPCGCKS
ncbi:RicAFT regulatory complex protein RicA family protein [Numidum massiliense]|uniref:RicAFT regulatory complex protein RicA family protein n=1 Tax=Numidum massiliense TaxID=1522315 RepID=UPI0006D58A6D|nr:YlbF family regulator [Numidum massiliense]